MISLLLGLTLCLLFLAMPFLTSPSCKCCAAIVCDACDTDTTPIDITVTFSGITDGTCDECTTLNDAFVCSQTQGGPSCTWEYTLPSVLCAAGDHIAAILIDIEDLSGSWTLDVYITDGTSNLFQWSTSGSGTVDCAFSAFDVPFNTGGVCTTSSSTCTLDV